MIDIIQQERLYQNKANSSHVSICNCKLDYWSTAPKIGFTPNLLIAHLAQKSAN